MKTRPRPSGRATNRTSRFASATPSLAAGFRRDRSTPFREARVPDYLPRIAGAGICCLDHIVTAPQAPWGDTALVSGYSVQGGGLVATALVACARLGAQSKLFSLLGDDIVADQVLAELAVEQVDTSAVVRVRHGASPFSFIHVTEHSGERTIYHRSGAGLNAFASSVDLRGIRGSHALLVDDVYPDLALSAARLARESGIPVVADMIPGPDSSNLLHCVDVLIAPRHFALGIGLENNLEAALRAIHEMGPSTAVITLGSEGWVCSGPNGSGRGGAFEVDVVDTTGAGDTFHGAFAYGLALGWDAARCCEFASAVAAIKCTQPGGRTGLPSLSRTIEFLQERSRLDWTGVC